jgi:hypothetical protein
MKKKLLVGLAFGMMMGGVAGTASATILTFDDVNGANPTTWDNEIYDGYGGLNWNDVYVLHQDLYPNSGYDLGVVSGEWVAYNVWDHIGTVDGTLFTFNGAYFTSAWDSDNTITAEGFLNGQSLFSASFHINNQAPTWLDFNFTGIDSLTLNSSGYHFAMDNFTFNETAPVPEPATMLLIGTGLAGLIGARRRKKA